VIDPRFYQTRGPTSASDIAAAAGANVARGDPEARVSTVAALAEAGPDALTFLEDGETAAASTLRAGVVLAGPGAASNAPASTTVVEARSPRAAFARAAAWLITPREIEPDQPFIHPSASIGDGSQIGPGAIIGAGAAIGREARIGPYAMIAPGVQIGARSRIGARAFIRCALIGDDVTILTGAVIGEAGFGLAPGAGGAILTPHFGRVIIQNNSSVGANSCIDRGLFEDTVLGESVHIDNLCHIGHNTKIGSHSAMAAFAGISGSVTIGEGVQMGGRVGIADHVRIGNRARLGAGSAVMRDVPDGETHGGYPARPIKSWMRQLAWVAREAQKRSGKD
jgi:UDP-3-O-[3-hydroxymyristoyl] glucosamine N-acyltransferase